MNIPDKAVEAGEWAVTNYLIAADEKEHWGAMDITPEEQRRVYLEAAAPFIVAQELTSVAHLTFGPGPVRDEILRVVRDVYEGEQ